MNTSGAPDQPPRGQLEAAYNLSFQSLSAPEARENAGLALVRLLQLSKEEASRIVDQPPALLCQSAAKEILLRTQAQLGRVGCLTRIDPVLKYRHWSLPATLMQRWKQIQSSEKTAVLAMVQATPAPGHQALSQALTQLDGDAGFALNHAQLLLDISDAAGPGAGRRLLELQQKLKAIFKHGDQGATLHSALALANGEKDSIEGVLDQLQRHLEGEAPAVGNARSMLPISRPIAGRAWSKLIRLGPPPASAPLSPEQHELLTRTWPLQHTEAKPAAYHEAKAADLIQRFEDAAGERARQQNTLMRHFHQIDHLPSLPSLTLQVYQLAQSSDSDIDELSRLVSADPGLSSRVLSVVNSTYYGLRQKIDSVTHAMVILGFEELAHLAMALSTERVFSGMDKDRGQRLWRHSAMTAEIARALAERLQRQDQAVAIYTAALLHDVGKVMQYTFCPDTMASLDAIARQEELPMFELELEHFGIEHAALGAALLQSWGLPEHLCAYVEGHHAPAPEQTPISEAAALIGVADHLAHQAMHSESWAEALRLRRSHGDALRPRLQALSLSLNELLQASDRSPRLRSYAL